MRTLAVALLLTLTLPAFAQAPLPRPDAPQVTIKGTPGARTLYYWVFARDARGHTQYSPVALVKNAPDVLSAANAVVVTPAPVPGASEYGLLTSRCSAPEPAQVKVTVGAPGDQTFYYWFQARHGRTVWSPVTGPLEVKACAATPANEFSWPDTGADIYFVYRTLTPLPPVGWRSCGVLSGGKTPGFTDKLATPEPRAIDPSGNPFDKPQGEGSYLVGTSTGDPITDSGQKLTSLLIYDMNTTDPAYNRFMPDIKGYEPSNERGAMQINFEHRVPSPKYSWDLLNSLSLQQRNISGGLNVYPLSWEAGSETGKNTYNGIDIHQFNYTPGQHSPYLTFMYNYGLGDNVFFHAAMEQRGQNRTPGDEGSEFFSLHATRRLESNRDVLAATSPAGSRYLRYTAGLGTIAGARGIVNLTQKHTAGTAHVEGSAEAAGTGTAWTPEMEGRWISFDADTTKGGHRQWYLIERFVSPTRLQLLAYTYWSRRAYLGKARTDGPYLICPYTEMTDGDAMTDQGLRVLPLTCEWRQGDEVEAIAGPQTTFRLGWWEMGGEFLPQDHAAGLGIAWNGDKPTSEGALITYNWGIGLEVHKAAVAVACMDETRVGLQAYKDTTVLISCIRDDPYRFQLSQDADGFVIEDYASQRWLALGHKGLTFYGDATLTGSERMRGKSTFSPDGQAASFTVVFKTPYPSPPFVVASANLPLGMGVTAVTAKDFTVTFASPPPAGQNNLTITWMVQE